MDTVERIARPTLPAPDGEGGELVTDVAVVGGGPVGALAAIVSAAAGCVTTLVAPERAHDPRTTALLMPAVALLSAHGVWDEVLSEAEPMRSIRIVDRTDYVPRAPEVAFDAHEIGQDQFGFNISNDVLNAALARRLASVGVARVDAMAEAFADGAAAARVKAGERTVRAKLVVAADGSQSLVRRAAGIGVRRWSYRQAAFVTTLSHERPHGGGSIEFHTPGGPCTLVPLPGARSSLVWVARPDEGERWSRLDPGPLAREVEGACHGVYGAMAVDGPRGVIPMEGLVALRLGTGRVVLVGEAAHRFPPIGAQGLNLGFRDVSELGDLLAQVGPRDLPSVPARYAARRQADVALRTASVDVLNRSLLTNAFAPTAARALALTAARGVGPVRRALMRFGLGPA